MQLSLLSKHNKYIVFQLAGDLKVVAFLPENAKPFGFDSATIINKKLTFFLLKSYKQILADAVDLFQSSAKKKLVIDVKFSVANTKKEQWFSLIIEKSNDKSLTKNLIVTATNITTIKLREEKLQQQILANQNTILTLQNTHQINQAIVNNSNVIILTLDGKNKITAISKYTESFTGYSLHELLGKDSLDLFTPKNKYPTLYQKINKHRKEDCFPKQFESTLLTKQGDEKIIIWSVSNLIINGQICGRISVGIDITERKNKDQQLLEREQRFRRITENIPLPVTICDTNGKVMFLNKKFLELIGYSLTDIPNLSDAFGYIKYPTETFEKKVQNEWYKLLKAFKKDKSVVFPSVERIVICKDGFHRHFEVSFSTEEDMLYIVFNDITLKLIANNSFERQKLFYESILNGIPSDIAVFDDKHRYLFVNPTAVKDDVLRAWLIGKTDEEYCNYRNKPMAIAQGRREIFNRVLTTKTLQSWEEELVGFGGKPDYHLRNMYPIIDTDGSLKMIIGYGINITKRKLAEKQLQESEQRFKSIADHTPIPICNFDKQMNISYINNKFLDVIGYKFEEITDAELWPHFIYYPDAESIETGRAEWKVVIEKTWKYPNSKTEVLERTIICKNGEYKIFEVSFAVNNKLVYAILNEVTEKRKAEKLLFESEQRFKALAENMPIAIGSHDIDGKIIFLNKHFLNSVGYSQNDIPTLTDWYLKTQPDIEIRKILYNNWLDTIDAYRKGVITSIPYIETAVLCKNGDTRTFNFLFSIYKDIVYIMLVDITERKKVEQELINSHLQLRELASHLQKIREEERKYIAREIHDELGQLVTGLKMDISLTKKKLEKQLPELGEKLANVMNLTDEIVHTVRRIASELRPSILDDIGLDAALEWQAKEFEKRTSITCIFTNNTKDISVNMDIKSNLFRIFQESLTNIIRHANATKVVASLTILNNNLMFVVNDNGDGIKNINQQRTFGLLGMKERIIMINGIFNIDSFAGKGTTITISVPLD
ncbi:MAG: PAS domain S-box protein [Pedobacter sp.]|nr:PAS domain S-box protein [Chitinophagaceae bacterium]